MITLKKLFQCQKVFRVCKDRKAINNLDPRFSGYKIDVLEAMQNLKPASFNVYMYLFMNQEGYIGGLSKVDVMNKTGISDGSYSNAVKELIEKGYLVYTSEFAISEDGVKAPIYDFHARPVANFT